MCTAISSIGRSVRRFRPWSICLMSVLTGCATSWVHGPDLSIGKLNGLRVGETSKGDVRALYGRSYARISSHDGSLWSLLRAPRTSELSPEVFGWMREFLVGSPMDPARAELMAQLAGQIRVRQRGPGLGNPKGADLWRYGRTAVWNGFRSARVTESWILTVSFDESERLGKLKWRWKAPKFKPFDAGRREAWKRIAAGMTRDEVEKLVGRPAGITIECDAGGHRETWSYGTSEVSAGSSPRVAFDRNGTAIKCYVEVPVRQGRSGESK